MEIFVSVLVFVVLPGLIGAAFAWRKQSKN
jgi:hypothetical protein